MMSTSLQRPYVGRFAPSPSGPLHAGSLVAALASYLDARVHNGRWLLRIEDVDETRTIPGAADAIQTALLQLGMQWDGPVLVQSKRTDDYREACRTLEKHVYPCGCSRKEIMDSRLGVAADGATIYPGTCRAGLAFGRQARALRLRVPDTGQPGEYQQFEDRWLGQQSQHLASEVGDFVLKRADGFWAYQLAVVVDDAQQDVTHVVRGADLLDSTARQMYLQDLLDYPAPAYLHLPLVRHNGGEKLSKQNGAQALDLTHPLAELQSAARFLGLDLPSTPSLAKFWDQAQAAWLRKLPSLPVRA